MQRHSRPAKNKKNKRKRAPGYIKGENESEEGRREFTVMTVHLFTLAAELISAFEW